MLLSMQSWSLVSFSCLGLKQQYLVRVYYTGDPACKGNYRGKAVSNVPGRKVIWAGPMVVKVG